MPTWNDKVRALENGGLAWGATNSGKTYPLSNFFARRVAKGGRHLLIGSALRLLEGEVIPDMIEHARRHGVYAKRLHRSSMTFRIGKGVIVVRAFRKAGDEEMLRSIHNIDSLMAEEVAAIPEVCFDMAVSRMRLPLGPIWATCNPSDPLNWVKQRLDSGRWAASQCFFVEDNPSLTPAQIEEFTSQFVGTFKSRMIDALWVAPEGLVYPAWYPSEAPLEANAPCYMGVDYGESNVTAAIYAQYADGAWVISGEYYYDAARQGARNPAEHASAIIAAAPGPVSYGYIDPTARPLKQALRAAGVKMQNAYTKIDGYQITDGMLQGKEFLVNEGRAPRLVEQLFTLRWDRHGDRPDPNCIDHATDCLRYMACGLTPIRRARIG